MRIVIIGWPGTGKTTLGGPLAESYGVKLRSTDDLIEIHDWSEASLAASKWFDEPGPWVIEGVAVVRALRKWRANNPDQPPPVDKVIEMTQLRRELPQGAVSMGKGHDKVLCEIMGWFKSVEYEIR